MARVLSKSRTEAPTPGARRFKALAFVSRAYEDAAGDWWLEGVASGPALDSYGERMSPECVADMGEQMTAGQVRLLAGHFNDWEGVLGWIKGGEVNLAGLLTIRCWLDKQDADVQKLWRQLNGDEKRGIQPAKLGLSVGGWLIDGHSEIVDGDYVFTIDKLQLDHVAVTSRPANPEAWITDVEVKHKEFARPWLRDIAKSASGEMRRAIRKGGDPLDPKDAKVKEETPPAEQAKETPSSDQAAAKDEGPDIEQVVKSAFDAAIAVFDEMLKSATAQPAHKYVRAIDLVGEELVAVKDESAAADTGEGEGNAEDPAAKADPADEAEGEDLKGDAAEKSARKLRKESDMDRGDVMDQLELARIKAKRLERENAELRAKAGGGQRKGLHDGAADDAVTTARQSGGESADKGNWVEQLKATKEYKEASRADKMEMVKNGLPEQVRRHYANQH